MTGEVWRDEALRRFPDLTAEIRQVETPYALWIDLWSAFVDALRFRQRFKGRGHLRFR